MTGFSGLSASSRVSGALVLLGLLLLPQSGLADTFYIEIDYMVDTDHTHMPQPDEIAAVVQMFACEGHTLVIDVDDALTHRDVLLRDPADNSFFDYNAVANSYGKIKDDFFDRADSTEWHYGLFAHQYEDTVGSTSGSSGLGQRPGRLFLVTLGSFTDEVGTPFDRASTLAHEFGHNLGLGHCGTMNCGDSDDIDYVGQGSPGLASIMSYQYQLAGVKEQMIALGIAREDASLIKELDFSRGRMCSQNEASLDEDFGSGMNPVDWDCSGTASGIVAVDLLSEGSSASRHWCQNFVDATTTIEDYNEWANVSGSASPEFLASSAGEPEEVACITFEEWEQIYTTQGIQQPTLLIEPCNSGTIIFVDPTAHPSFQFGTCKSPARDMDFATGTLATDDSELYLRGGTYDSGIVPLVISKPMKIFSVGRAIVR